MHSHGGPWERGKLEGRDKEIFAARDRKLEAARAKRKERRQATPKEVPEQRVLLW